MSDSTTPVTSGVVTWVHPGKLFISLVVGSLIGIGMTLPLDPVIRMPEDLGSWPFNPTPEYIVRYNKASSNMWMGNTAINFALLGAGIGSVAALLYAHRAAAISRMMAAVLSLIGGTAGGALSGYLLASAHSNQGHLTLFGWQMDFMLQSVLLQTIAWGGLGIGLGVAIARVHSRPWATGLQAGILGGFLAGLLHALVGTIAFPNSDTSLIMPLATVERFVWATYCALGVGGGIWLLLREPKRQEPKRQTDAA